MKLGMAVVSRIVTGEEPCLRKILYEIERPLPVDARIIQYKMEHELLVAKTIEGLTGDVYVNEWVTRNVGGMQVNGKIDIVSIDNGITTIIEVKSRKEKESHHVQLWMYMGCYDSKRTKGELRCNEATYKYREADMPLNLWNVVFERTRSLLKGNLQQVKVSVFPTETIIVIPTPVNTIANHKINPYFQQKVTVYFHIFHTFITSFQVP